eukprot:2960123-Rhodomonas_salina.2
MTALQIQVGLSSTIQGCNFVDTAVPPAGSSARMQLPYCCNRGTCGRKALDWRYSRGSHWGHNQGALPTFPGAPAGGSVQGLRLVVQAAVAKEDTHSAAVDEQQPVEAEGTEQGCAAEQRPCHCPSLTASYALNAILSFWAGLPHPLQVLKAQANILEKALQAEQSAVKLVTLSHNNAVASGPSGGCLSHGQRLSNTAVSDNHWTVLYNQADAGNQDCWNQSCLSSNTAASRGQKVTGGHKAEEMDGN